MGRTQQLVAAVLDEVVDVQQVAHCLPEPPKPMCSPSASVFHPQWVWPAAYALLAALLLIGAPVLLILVVRRAG